MIDIDVDVDATSVLLLLSRVEEATSMDHVALAFGDSGPVLATLQQQVAARFASEGDDASGDWAPLSLATLDIKDRMGYGGNATNVRTGRMRSWIVNDDGDLDWSPGGVFFTWPAEPSGKLADKFETAQFGSADTGAPPRPIVAADVEDLNTILQVLGAWIYGFMGAAPTGSVA